jgi:steroid delta-isomerase-like uncharacterized protein
MSTTENKAVIERWNEEAFNTKRHDRLDDVVTQDYVDHSAMPGQAPGLEGARQKVSMYVNAIPDLRVTIEEMVAEGDKVAVHWLGIGTHQGELFGIPLTGKPIRIDGISICRVAHGKLAEQIERWDRLDLMQQLGVIPAPSRTG